MSTLAEQKYLRPTEETFQPLFIAIIFFVIKEQIVDSLWPVCFFSDSVCLL